MLHNRSFNPTTNSSVTLFTKYEEIIIFFFKSVRTLFFISLFFHAQKNGSILDQIERFSWIFDTNSVLKITHYLLKMFFLNLKKKSVNQIFSSSSFFSRSSPSTPRTRVSAPSTNQCQCGRRTTRDPRTPGPWCGLLGFSPGAHLWAAVLASSTPPPCIHPRTAFMPPSGSSFRLLPLRWMLSWIPNMNKTSGTKVSVLVVNNIFFFL